jgi:hypothetical protein
VSPDDHSQNPSQPRDYRCEIDVLQSGSGEQVRLDTRFFGETNPFTGEIQTSLPVEPPSAKDVRAIQEVLAAAGARGPDEFGRFAVELGVGGGAEVFASNLETGWMIAVR